VSLTWRYRLEVVMAVVASVMCAVTVAWPAWIETVFGVDPDHGSGWLEWLIVAVLAIAAVACGALARADWRWQQQLRAEPVAEGTNA
jgi:hypothetical protein